MTLRNRLNAPPAYSGDLRTSPTELAALVREGYEAGLSVAFLSEKTKIAEYTLRNFFTNYGVQRAPEKFEKALPCLSLPDEVFRRIAAAPDYFVSNFGRVLGMHPYRPGSFVKSAANPETGYFSAKLTTAEGKRHVYIHRAVLIAFVGPAPEGMQGAHGDGDKSNNTLVNLRWDTPKGNAADKVDHGTLRFGSSHPRAKTDEAVVPLIRAGLAQKIPHEKIARTVGVHPSCVANISQNKTWKRA